MPELELILNTTSKRSMIAVLIAISSPVVLATKNEFGHKSSNMIFMELLES